jgi:hypothetical protein
VSSRVPRALLGLALSGAVTLPAGGQEPFLSAPRERFQTVPFEVGEHMTYDVRFGAIKVGNGRLSVVGIDTVRGLPAWHVQFGVRGGTFFYKVDDTYESWMDRRNLNSLRYVQDTEQGSRERQRTFEMFPEKSIFLEVHKDNRVWESVPNPLDDGSFLFFIRTVPLVVGETYDFNRYFKPDRNPVRIRVLRKERIKVPAGTFDAIVLQPIIKTSGIFSEGGQAEIWLSDDEKRIMLQMKSRLSFGSLNLYLRTYRYTAPDTTAVPPAGDGR